MNAIVLLAAALAPGEMPVPVMYAPRALPPADPPAKLPDHADARREARDLVLRSVGKDALAFTKKFGDLGIYSLQACEPETGKKLVKLYNAGELGKLKNPRAALEAVRKHGDPAGAWLAEHHAMLEDPEALECWCGEPMEYVYDLKDIEQEAAQCRAHRKSLPPWLANVTAEWNVPYVIIAVLAALLLLVCVWKRRQPAP